MDNSQRTPTLLGEQIAKRLQQLGLSRREFCRRYQLSRQTMQHLEYDVGRGFAQSTFNIIDDGLKWERGTAEAFWKGQSNAREQIGGETPEQKAAAYVQAIMLHVVSMTPDELEREVLMLEEESYGRPLPTDEGALAIIRQSVDRLTNLMLEKYWADPKG